MGAQALTQLLTILLIVSVIIFFILIVVLFAITLKKKSKEKEASKEQDIKLKQEPKTSSNIVQTKMYTTENVKKFMDFDEIKDNMIIQKNGKRLVMVIQCQGVNYDLMSSIEKVGVEKGFIQFLNTITRPIQLYIQARKVNLEDSVVNYKKRLKVIEVNFNKMKIQYEQAQKNPNISDAKFKEIKLEYVRQKNLLEYTKDIISNTEKMSLNKNILTKNYYIAISYYPDNQDDLFKKEELLDMAFSELYTNAQSILRTLSVCGVTGKVLNSMELADLLYVAYNRDSSEIYGVDKAIRAGYDALYTTAPDVIDKKIEELNKLIEKRALDLANEAIDQATIKSRRKRELEEIEKNQKKLIQRLAKNMIKENEEYIGNEITNEAIKEIDQGVAEKKTKESKREKGA